MKTRILRDGDKGRAICEDCRARVTTTYRRRDVPMSDGSGLVRNVLVGVCDTCDTIVSLPQQSVPMVKAVVKRKRTSVEARVPVHVRDMLAMVSDAMGHGPGFDQHIVRFYISEWAEKGVPRTRLARYRRDELFYGNEATARLSYKFRGADDLVNTLREESGMNTTELLKAVTFAAYEDVIERPQSRARKALKNIASVVG